MPSSLEATVVAWQPDELRAEAGIPAVSTPKAAPDELFEVSSVAGVPAQLVEAARRRAEAAGYAAGWSRGVSAARLAVEAEAVVLRGAAEQDAARARNDMQQALAAVTGAAAHLLARTAPAIAGFEDLIVAASFEIAEAVIGATVRDNPDRGAVAIGRALAFVPDADEVSIALHPADRQVVLASGVAVPAHVRLVDDPSLAPGDARARSGSTTVDARIRAGVDRVRAVLVR